MTDYEAWLRTYFQTNGAEVPDEVNGLNYFNAGFIDSFEVMILIERIETEFAIRMSESDFQDRRFPTVSGLAEMIKEKSLQNGSLP